MNNGKLRQHCYCFMAFSIPWTLDSWQMDLFYSILLYILLYYIFSGNHYFMTNALTFFFSKLCVFYSVSCSIQLLVQLLFGCFVWLLYTAVQQTQQPYIHYPPFLDFLSIQVSREYREEFPVLCSRFSLVIYFMHRYYYVYIRQSQQYTYVNPNLPVHPPTLPPWYADVCSLRLCLYFCFANMIIFTTFLDSTYMH